jgi:hypothetical protein
MQIHRYQAMQRIVQAAEKWNRDAYVEDVIEKMLGEEIMPLLRRYMEIFPDENIGIWGGTHDAFVQYHPQAWEDILDRVAFNVYGELDREDLIGIMTGRGVRVCDWNPEDVVRHWLNHCSDAEIDFSPKR